MMDSESIEREINNQMPEMVDTLIQLITKHTRLATGRLQATDEKVKFTGNLIGALNRMSSVRSKSSDNHEKITKIVLQALLDNFS
jgi:hypothetical protein